MPQSTNCLSHGTQNACHSPVMGRRGGRTAQQCGLKGSDHAGQVHIREGSLWSEAQGVPVQVADDSCGTCMQRGANQIVRGGRVLSQVRVQVAGG